MRQSDLFVLAAKLVVMTGFKYKESQDITQHERDAIDNGLRELRFYDPNFADKYVKDDSLATRSERKSARKA